MLPYTSCTMDSFQSLKSSLVSKVHGRSLQTNAVLVFIFQVTYFQEWPVVPESHGPQTAYFRHVVPATFTGNAIDTVRNSLWSTYWSSSHKRVFQAVPHLAHSFNIVSVRFKFELLRESSYIKYRYKTEWLHLLLQQNISLGFVDNKINRPSGTCMSCFKATISSDQTCCSWHMKVAL
jgi:hypothetical protein